MRFILKRNVFIFGLFYLAIALFATPLVHAQSRPVPPDNAFSVATPFKKNLASSIFNGKTTDISYQRPKEEPVRQEPTSEAKALREQLEREKLLGRVDRSAPEEFQNMIVRHRAGDTAGANRGADAFVGYMMNLMFEVRDITNLIGAALVRKGLIDEESWDGVGQYLDYEMTQAREENGTPLRPTHEESLKRVTPDPKNQVEIFFFFTLNSKWSRLMAPDVERLWLATKNDPRVKMVALTLGPQPKEWIDSYKAYTGLTVPIMEGGHVAAEFDVKFVPALVVVAPNLGQAYLRTGEQDFSRMYEFVRAAQGLPFEVTPQLQQIASMPIGEVERLKSKASDSLATNLGLVNTRGYRAQAPKSGKLERF